MMIVNCPKGHKFDNDANFECPECEAELTSKYPLIDVLELTMYGVL